MPLAPLPSRYRDVGQGGRSARDAPRSGQQEDPGTGVSVIQASRIPAAGIDPSGAYLQLARGPALPPVLDELCEDTPSPRLNALLSLWPRSNIRPKSLRLAEERSNPWKLKRSTVIRAHVVKQFEMIRDPQFCS